MEKEQEQLEALQDIRKLMKESSKFLSLSGISGVLAGVYAFIGAYFAYSEIQNFNQTLLHKETLSVSAYTSLIPQFVFISLAVLIASILTAIYFSNKKAKKDHHKLFDHSSKHLLWQMAIPLAAGAIFCLALIYQGQDMLLLLSPVMLIFYGLALIASSKFTVHDIKYLGYLQVSLGLINLFCLSAGILFWLLGFGVLHIIYGSIMWFKYDRRD